ncbi:unnamed protein product [Blepharisma stoltei]|uniref:Uncharacterized protein n=1 Tax=Blepharisma stoltei TaxID=1481888 RepID=A0AAU9K4J4_9CILI|nr:unnamed protein product [Blepharisma stoltei]
MNSQKSLDDLKAYSYFKKQPYVNYSRSKEIFYDDIGTTNDKVLYNTTHFNVFRYQCSPNRDETPIKPPARAQTTGFLRRRQSRQELMLSTMASKFSNIDPRKKQELIGLAKTTKLRSDESYPRLVSHQSRRLPFVMNDYHIRETNPGFARNDLGNFFTH